METPTFKKGDHVRLKAWVRPRRASAIGRLFEHGWVGVVKCNLKDSAREAVIVQHQHNPGFAFGESAVYVEDLELMPERQVHVVKDGKVYELREHSPAVSSCNSCCFYGCFCEYPPAPGIGQFNQNFQEVASGKLVS